MIPLVLVALLQAAPERRSAQELAHQSIVDYNLGNFAAALDEAQRAYRIDQRPALLFNLGQCHRALGHWAKAAFFYKGYLRDQAAAKNRAQVEALLHEMEAKEGAAQAPSGSPPPPPAAAPAPAAAIHAEAAAPPAPPDAVGAPSVVVEEPAPRARSAWPWVLGAGTVLALGAATVGWVEVGSFEQQKGQSAEAPVTKAQFLSAQGSAQWGEPLGIVAAIAAAGLLVGTVVTW